MKDANAKMGTSVTHCQYASHDFNILASKPQTISDIVAELAQSNEDVVVLLKTLYS